MPDRYKKLLNRAAMAVLGHSEAVPTPMVIRISSDRITFEQEKDQSRPLLVTYMFGDLDRLTDEQVQAGFVEGLSRIVLGISYFDPYYSS